MTDELIPDNPHLQQIDALFRQITYNRVKPTKNDIEFADLMADSLRLWAGIPIVPPEELEEAMRDDPPPSNTPQTWAERADIAKRDASLRRN
jgi:hypothetical protein